jgi:hypothetical protein
MERCRSRVILFLLVLLAVPVSTLAKEGEGVTLRETVASKSVGEKIRDIADRLGEKATARLIFGKLAGVLEPTKLGDATLSPEQRAEFEQSTPSDGVASPAVPQTRATTTQKDQPAPESTPRTVSDRGDNADRHSRSGGDNGGRSGGEDRSTPRERAGLGDGPSHEGRP